MHICLEKKAQNLYRRDSTQRLKEVKQLSDPLNENNEKIILNIIQS